MLHEAVQGAAAPLPRAAGAGLFQLNLAGQHEVGGELEVLEELTAVCQHLLAAGPVDAGAWRRGYGEAIGCIGVSIFFCGVGSSTYGANIDEEGTCSAVQNVWNQVTGELHGAMVWIIILSQCWKTHIQGQHREGG